MANPEPITYKQADGRVALELSTDDFMHLLWLLGVAAGAFLKEREPAKFWECLDFTNRVNLQNPSFTRYEIPGEEHADSS